MTALAEAASAVRIHVRGVVQGVGFRPFVHRLASRHGLHGWVRNESGTVEIALEGPRPGLRRFAEQLGTQAPPLARIDTIELESCSPQGQAGFAVLPSRAVFGERQPVPADVGLCPQCEHELFDSGNRRYHYPFITCTDCGPRYTVITAMPYDRHRTSMGVFPQCPECSAEYQTPGNRRYHAETNCCPECGPVLRFEGGDPRVDGDGDPLGESVRLLEAGSILALRGVGGFHLAVDAGDDAAVARLRDRKHREAKPFAVMVRTIEDAGRIAAVSPEEERVLLQSERPIVLLERRPSCGIAEAVAPGINTLGVMLPYTPLHHVLLARFGRPLVMTSGNVSDEPILGDNIEALERLGGIADGFLLHDREIVSRCDDSVVQVVAGIPRMLRRARGFAPLPVRVPRPSPLPLVAVGPHLKNTFTLLAGDRAWISPHLGDLESLSALDLFHQTLTRYRTLFHIDPRVAVHDLHPGYLSTRIAQDLGLERTIGVQHHHAHVAAVLAEHGETGPAVGITYDGTGWGEDGTVWGGEILVADLSGYRRMAQLISVPLPGGDLAARTPWRSALGYLALDRLVSPAFALAFRDVPPEERSIAEQQIARGVNAPLSSSMGRLFDAAAAVLGVRKHCDYEGQAAMELQALAGRRPAREIRSKIDLVDGRWVINPLALLMELGERRIHGEDVRDLAADFHASIAWITTLVATRIGEQAGIRRFVLAGGVFQNSRLLASVQTRLEEQGLEVLVPRLLSANDGAISYGQAAVAAARLAAA